MEPPIGTGSPDLTISRALPALSGGFLPHSLTPLSGLRLASLLCRWDGYPAPDSLALPHLVCPSTDHLHYVVSRWSPSLRDAQSLGTSFFHLHRVLRAPVSQPRALCSRLRGVPPHTQHFKIVTLVVFGYIRFSIVPEISQHLKLSREPRTSVRGCRAEHKLGAPLATEILREVRQA